MEYWNWWKKSSLRSLSGNTQYSNTVFVYMFIDIQDCDMIFAGITFYEISSEALPHYI